MQEYAKVPIIQEISDVEMEKAASVAKTAACLSKYTTPTRHCISLESGFTAYTSYQAMAKSLRSKTKRAFRRIKREDPKSDYHIRDKLRLQRLNEKLKVLKSVSDDENEDGEEVAVQDGLTMEQDGDATAASQQGDSHHAHEGSSDFQHSEHEDMTKLYWILGMLDPDALTLACPARGSSHERGDVLDVLQRLCSTC